MSTPFDRKFIAALARQHAIDAKTMHRVKPFVLGMVAKERERFALECIDLVAMYGGPVELEAAIRARSAP